MALGTYDAVVMPLVLASRVHNFLTDYTRCGNCFIMSGGGICLDPGLAAPPPGSTSKKRDAEAAPQAPQPPAPGQCQDVACSNNDVCNGIG